MHTRPEGYPWPQLAFQPPYFFSREVIEKIISVDVPADPKTPFIDWWMMAVAIAAKIPYACFRDGMSCPTSDMNSLNVMSDAVTNRGAIFVHSIKTPRALSQVVGCRRYHVRKYQKPAPPARGASTAVNQEKGVWVRFDQKR
jgi:hypothetical protein